MDLDDKHEVARLARKAGVCVGHKTMPALQAFAKLVEAEASRAMRAKCEDACIAVANRDGASEDAHECECVEAIRAL